MPEVQNLSQNVLGHYFYDLSILPVLLPEQEFELAKAIEDAEVTLWSHILSYPHVIEPLVAYVEQKGKLKSRFLVKLRAHARAYLDNPQLRSRRLYDRWRNQAARELVLLDSENSLATAVLGQLRRLRRKDVMAFGVEATSLTARGQSFKKYYQGLWPLNRIIQQKRNEFVQANLRLVVTIARRFNYGNIPLHDLIQEGNIGLIKAVGRYDYRRGFRFSTYASWWIRHAITRAIADKGRLVRVPVHMLSNMHKVSRRSRELSSKLGRQPTSDEIGSITKLSAQKIEEIKEYTPNQSLSLDTRISDHDDRQFVEMIQDLNVVSPTDCIGNQEIFDKTLNIINTLSPMEADILRRRFGLHDGTEHTLRDIGHDYQLSRERIRQIQEQAIGKIRRALMRQNAI